MAVDGDLGNAERSLQFDQLMKIPLLLVAALVGVFGISTTSCNKKPSADQALDEALKALAQPGTGQQASPPPGQTPPPTLATPSPTIAATPVSLQMTQAVVSYKSGHYEDAVVRLQWLRAREGNTPEQLMALQEAMAAVMGDIYARAERGDAAARRAVKEYERLQNSR
jgi:hypothetical protein